MSAINYPMYPVEGNIFHSKTQSIHYTNGLWIDWLFHCRETVASKPNTRPPKALGEKATSLEGSEEETERLHDYLKEQLGAQSALRVHSR